MKDQLVDQLRLLKKLFSLTSRLAYHAQTRSSSSSRQSLPRQAMAGHAVPVRARAMLAGASVVLAKAGPMLARGEQPSGGQEQREERTGRGRRGRRTWGQGGEDRGGGGTRTEPLGLPPGLSRWGSHTPRRVGRGSPIGARQPRPRHPRAAARARPPEGSSRLRPAMEEGRTYEIWRT